MMFGRERFDLAGEEFLRIVQEELARKGRPATPDDAAAVLGLSPNTMWEWLDQRERGWLDELVSRWNAQAEPNGFTPVLLVDHGDEVELFIGLFHPAPA
ncbi:MAG: hypothetical protein Q8P18_32895 [Pseudomonadota bacterium]|nr:hypothetical protein [Pseudomonadota bacterium]